MIQIARNCNCAGQTCGCAVVGVGGISVSGIGTSGNPFEISLEDLDIGGLLIANDSSTIDLTLLGSGTALDPYILSAVALSGVPSGGLTGQQLVKSSGTNYATAWVDPNRVLGNAQIVSYTPVLTDAGKNIEMTLGTATVLTIPLNAAQAFPLGTIIEVTRLGAGTVTITPTGGVTLLKPFAVFTLRAQYSTARLRKIATDTWVLSGDIG